MSRTLPIVGLLLVAVAVPAAAPAQSLRYWGKQGDGATGWVQVDRDTLREVAPGTHIPGWGRVKEVRDDRIVVERVLSEAEQTELREQGAVTYDAVEIHIVRQDLQVQGVPYTRGPGR